MTPDIDDEIPMEKVPWDKFDLILYADFEAFTVDDEGNNIEHEAFMICYGDGENFFEGRNIFSLINYIKRTDAENVLMYFHNLTYDAQFITNQRFEISSPLFVDGKPL